MKPREAFSILATALLIGTVIAQDQLFECPRGKKKYALWYIYFGLLSKIKPCHVSFSRFEENTDKDMIFLRHKIKEKCVWQNVREMILLS